MKNIGLYRYSPALNFFTHCRVVRLELDTTQLDASVSTQSRFLTFNNKNTTKMRSPS